VKYTTRYFLPFAKRLVLWKTMRNKVPHPTGNPLRGLSAAALCR